MFVTVLNWMLRNVPGFMRPAVNWLVDGIRKITSHISARWNVLGMAAGVMYGAISGLRTQITTYVLTLANFTHWLTTVYVPRKVHESLDWLQRITNSALAALRQEVAVVRDAIVRWVSQQVGRIDAFIDGVTRWATRQIDELLTTLGQLRRALAHVTSGPRLLAEWLVGEMWGALGRHLYAARDRIAQWLSRESVAFTRFIATTIEDVLVRIL